MLEAIQSLIRGAKGVMSPAIKRAILEAENSLLSRAEFKFEGSYTSTSPLAFVVYIGRRFF
jgi:hypothetical protein